MHARSLEQLLCILSFPIEIRDIRFNPVEKLTSVEDADCRSFRNFVSSSSSLLTPYISIVLSPHSLSLSFPLILSSFRSTGFANLFQNLWTLISYVYDDQLNEGKTSSNLSLPILDRAINCLIVFR